MIVSRSNLGLIGCEEWRVASDRLDLLLKQADGMSIQDSAGYTEAKSYRDSTSGFSSPIFLFGAACTTQVDEANRIVGNLQSAISAAGQTPVTTAGPVAQQPSPLDQIPTIVKWVAGGAIAIALAVLAVEVVPLFSHLKRKK